MDTYSGHAIFLIGIPSAGKTTAAAEIVARVPSFVVLAVDELIHRFPQREWLDRLPQIFDMALAETNRLMQTGNVVVDAVWDATQVEYVKELFGSCGLYVVMRIDEQERRSREQCRFDRKVHYWDPVWNDKPGPDHLYDLVIDAQANDPAQCATLAIAEAEQRWGTPV